MSKLASLRKGQAAQSLRGDKPLKLPDMYIGKPKDLNKSHLASKAQNCSLYMEVRCLE